MKKSNVKILLIVVLMLMEGISIFFAYKSYLSNPKENKVIRNNKTYAIMLEDQFNLGTYNEYPEDSWPGVGYILNIEMSSCVDNAGNEMTGLLTFDNETRIATVKSKKETYCYLYFKYDPAPVEISDFSITEVKKNNNVKYTNLQRNKAILDWTDDDIQYFCLTESEEKARVACEDKWTKSNNVNHIEVNFDFDNIDNEVKTVYAYTKDYGGSISPRKEEKIILDTKGPTVASKEIGEKNNDTNSWYKSMSITLSGEDGTFGIGMKEIKYCVTTEVDKMCELNKTISGKEGVITLPTSDKNQKICYQGTDLLDQKGTENTCTSVTYQVDGIKPEISFDIDKEEGEPGWFKKVEIKVSGSDEGSGVESVKTCVTTEDTCDPDSNETTKRLEDKNIPQKVCVEAIDRAGNSSGVICTDETYRVDGTAPSCGEEPHETSGGGSTTGVSGYVECSDETSGCTNTTFGFTNYTRTDNVTIKDKAGNTANCSVPITSHRQKRTASCRTGNKCAAAGCIYVQSTSCACTSSSIYQYQSSRNESRSPSSLNNDVTISCTGSGSRWRCISQTCYSRSFCICDDYYEDAGACGCASWYDWSGWSNVGSCSTSNGNTSKTDCQTIYYLTKN